MVGIEREEEENERGERAVVRSHVSIGTAMGGQAVRYSRLSQSEQDNDIMKDSYSFDFSTPPGTFDSVFTYARYGDIDRMGYEAPKRYRSQWNSNKNYTYSPNFDEREELNDEGGMNWIELLLILLSYTLILFTLPLSLLLSLRFISSSQRLVLLRLGKAQKTRGPGAAIVLPCIDTWHVVDIRVTAFNVPPLHIITADRGLIQMGATVFLRVRDALAAVCQVQDRNESMRTLASSMLYRYVNKKRICELTGGHERRILAGMFKDELVLFTSQFGVEITQVELSEMTVIKEAENMGLACLSSVARSEIGQNLWNVVGPTLEEAMQVPKKQELQKEKEDEEEEVDIDKLITTINMVIDQSLTMAIGKVFQFECGDLQVVVDLRKGICYKGTAICADTTLHIDRNILLPILRQQLSPMSAYMGGQLKVSGNIQDALSLRLLTDRIVHLL